MKRQIYHEVNFDGIVGPTHHYGGLAHGNVASMASKKNVSNPKEAALQGLEKMKFLMDLGLKQAVLPPHERPYLPLLRALGFHGSHAEILHKAAKETPEILSACCSSAAMWTANAGTMTPSTDSADRRVHFTPANLASHMHRAIEHETTSAILKAIFEDPAYFVHHPALLEGIFFSDEGAANHSRFCKEYGSRGVHLFVYGKSVLRKDSLIPVHFPARQTLEASQAIARRHGLTPETCIFAQQHPQAIDSGIFHNDVISVGNKHVFLCHELAFVNTEAVLLELEDKVKRICGSELNLICIPQAMVSLNELVTSYMCNSQIVSLPDESMMLIAPSDCQKIPSVKTFIDKMLADQTNPINQVTYFNLHQSLRNGGGPACLRFRVVLNDNELQAMSPHVLLTPQLYKELKTWIEKYYRDNLTPEDLCDPSLLDESYAALNDLTKILHLGHIYPFQSK